MNKRVRTVRRPPPRRSLSLADHRRRDFPGQDLILDVLEQTDALRERQHLLDMKRDYLLATGFDIDRDDNEVLIDVVGLQRGWNAFLREGGVTADDLRAYLRGERIGSARVKRHLRLVSNNTKPSRYKRVLGHDAA